MLAAALLLAVPDTAQAQRYGIGMGRGGTYFGNTAGYGYPGSYGSGWGNSPYMGSYNSGWNYGNAGYYGNNAWNYGNPGYNGNNWTTWGNNWNNSPGYYNSGYYNPGYQSTYTFTNPQPGYQAFYPSTTQSGYSYGSTSDTFAGRNDSAAHLEVRVPANAEVFFEGHKTAQTGTVRHFVSPSLDANQNYTYTVRAHWNENGQDIDRTKQVTVRAGQAETVDFTGGNTTTDINRTAPNSRIEDVTPTPPASVPNDRAPTPPAPNRGNIRDIPPADRNFNNGPTSSDRTFDRTAPADRPNPADRSFDRNNTPTPNRTTAPDTNPTPSNRTAPNDGTPAAPSPNEK